MILWRNWGGWHALNVFYFASRRITSESSMQLLLLREETQQAAISQKEIVFRFRKDVQSEKGWGLISCA